MPIVDPNALEIVDQPELVFGLAAPVGTPLSIITDYLQAELKDRKYVSMVVRLSDLLDSLQLSTTHPPPSASEYERVSALMNRGNELRQTTGSGEALALLAVSRIYDRRPDREPFGLSGNAFILNQLKHPDEVYWLRKIYGPAFHLISVYCPESTRRENLVRKMKPAEADALIARDQGEAQSYGQQLRDTYHLADVFVSLTQKPPEAAAIQIRRYIRLLFGDFADEVITPTIDEYGMYLAHAASLRSADLSRQVGAAILAPDGDVQGVGTNEVPASGGGQYWPGSERDARDFKLGYDSNARIMRETLAEALEILDPEYHGLGEAEKAARLEQVCQALRSSRMMSLTEFGRAVHAEMSAILSASRMQTSIAGSNIFTTTYPCHNCAKHIVASGLKRVVYIEPYPKSLAVRLHVDSILTADGAENDGRVTLESFVGVSPRVFQVLFSILSPEGRRLPRKTDTGDMNRTPFGLRANAPSLTYVDREAAAALAATKIGQIKTVGGD